MKKALSLVLSILLTFSMAVSALAVNFPDVDSNYSWAKDAIEELSAHGVVNGYEDGSFKPGKSITRQEAIALFSRALGAGEEVNKQIVDLAYGIYEADIIGCEDSYAAKQGAYMIYRKVLTAKEVVDYLGVSTRNNELKRYEAATLIAKALGADSWLAANKDFTLTFEDKDKIPNDAEGYVYYTTALGIMKGVDDKNFAPNDTVTRAQIAVMIKRILDTMKFEYVRGMISGVDTLQSNLSIKTEEGETIKFGVNNSPIYLDGEKTTLVSLDTGMECVFIFSNDSLYQIDAITYDGDEIVVGVYRGKTTSGSGTTITLDDVDADTSIAGSYKLASGVVVQVNGDAATLNDIANGNLVVAKISGGLVVSLSAEPKTKEVTGAKITDILASADGVIISVSTKDGDADYELADGATITRNGKTETFSKLAIGDSVSITLEYRKIAKIIATGKEKNVEGMIEEITISNATSYITISSDGSKYRYPMSRDCAITLEGETASIYDLRLGAYIKLTLSSDMVSEIETEAVSTALSLTGTVKTINASYGLVIITYPGANGATVEKQLFLDSKSKILNSTTGKFITLKELSVGNVVTAAGTEKLGVYEVSSLMVLQ